MRPKLSRGGLTALLCFRCGARGHCQRDSLPVVDRHGHIQHRIIKLGAKSGIIREDNTWGMMEELSR